MNRARALPWLVAAVVGATASQARPNSRGEATLRSTFGVAAASEDLARPIDGEEGRLRRIGAIERLGRIATRPALDRLNELAQSDGLDGRELVTLSRALAPHARDSHTRRTLGRLLAESSRSATDQRAEHARAIAALGLAKEGSTASLRMLGSALRRDAETSRLAADALRTHPPARLESLLTGPASARVAELLGEVADQRAFHPLRSWVRRAPIEVQAAAAVSLFRLGALETVELASWWLEQPALEYRKAAAEILVGARTELASDAIQSLLEAGEVDLALDLARRAPTEAMLEELAALGDRLSRPHRASLFAIAGAVGSEAAVDWLGEQLLRPDQAISAAQALSTIGSPAAVRVLEKHATNGRLRRIVVRALRIADSLHGTSNADRYVAPLQKSKSVADRFVAQWLRATQSESAAIAALESEDTWRVVAVSHGAWLHSGSLFAKAGRALDEATSTERKLALAFALLHPDGAAEVSSYRLLEIARAIPALEATAAYALAQRSDSALRDRLQQWVTSPSATLRRATLTGLGASDDPWTLNLILERLRWETDAETRLCAVVALSARKEKSARRFLRDVADYEPVPQARRAGRVAVDSTSALSSRDEGGETLWLSVQPSALQAENAGSEPPTSQRPIVAVALAPGVVAPVLPAPDGVVTMSGLPGGLFGISLTTWDPR